MAQAKPGDSVKVHYTGKLTDGTVFDTSQDRDPLEFTIGEGQIILGLETAIVGMNPGESKTLTIPVEQAFGRHREDMVMEVNREHFPEHIHPEIGQELHMTREDGDTLRVQVTGVSESSVTLDANHPLAGKDLTFDIRLVEID